MRNFRFAVLAFILLVTAAFGQYYDFIGQLQFDPAAPNPTHSEAMMFYDNTHNAPTYYNDDPDVTVHLGHDMVTRVRNTHGSNLVDGDMVYITGSTGQTPNVVKAQANFVESSNLLGIWVAGTTATSSFGYVLTEGHIHNTDTSTFAEGDTLYLSDATAGALTNVKPLNPSKIIEVGIVTNSHATQGSIHIHIQAETRSEYVYRNLFTNNGGDAQENSDTTTALSLSFLSGNSATFASAGILAGTLATSVLVADQLEGTRVFKYTQAAGSLNDWISSPAITVPQVVNTTSVTLGYTFRYKYNGADGDLEIRALCVDDSSVLIGPGEAPLSASLYKATGSINIPKDCNEIKYGVQTAVLNSGKIFLFDEIKLADDPWIYKNLTVKQEYVLTQAQNAMTDIASEIEFNLGTATISNTGNTLIVATDDPGNTRTKFIAQKKCIVDINVSGALAAANRNLIILKNGAIVMSGSETPTTNRMSASGLEIELDVDDYITIGVGLENVSTASSLVSAATPFLLRIVATAEAEHVVTPAKSTLTDWAAYTPTFTGFGTVATENFSWRRVGSDIEISGTFTSGTQISTEYRISLPLGLTIGSDHIDTTPTGDLTTSAGKGTLDYWTGGTATNDYMNFYYQDSTNGYQIITTSGQMPVSGSTYYLTAKFPINNWDSLATFLAAIPTMETAYVKDVKASGVAGGTSGTQTVSTRTLNTVEGDTSIVSLSANQFTLGAGKYIIEGYAPAYQANIHQVHLYNITNSVIEKEGISTYAPAAASVQTVGEVHHTLTITTATTYELRHYIASGKVADGLGVDTASSPSNPVTQNIYATVKITQIKAGQ